MPLELPPQPTIHLRFETPRRFTSTKEKIPIDPDNLVQIVYVTSGYQSVEEDFRDEVKCHLTSQGNPSHDNRTIYGFDISGAPYWTKEGLSGLVIVHQDQIKRGKPPIGIIAPQGFARQCLGITRLDTLFHVCQTPEEYVQFVREQLSQSKNP